MGVMWALRPRNSQSCSVACPGSDVSTSAPAKLGVQYRYEDVDLQDTLDRLEEGSIDISIGALSLTRARDEAFDFTHAFYRTGLAIAVARSPEPFRQLLGRVLSWRLLKAVLWLFVVLLTVGSLLWLFERRRNPQQFGGSVVDGISAGFWWSAVTMTTVGYGDKSPRSAGGRVVAVVWMFASIALISGLIAGISSALTVTHLQSSIRGLSDLGDVRVGTVAASTSADFLREQRVTFRDYPRVGAVMKALGSGDLDAVVYDEPILRHIASESYPGEILVLPRTFERQFYAFGLPQGSPLREPINHALIGYINDDSWQDVLYRHLGN